MELQATRTAKDSFITQWPELMIFLVIALPFWLVFLIPALPICLTIWFLGCKRVAWNKLDFSILIVPYLAWLTLIGVGDLPKSLSNGAMESLYLGLAVGVAPLIRLILPRSWNGTAMATILLLAACAAGAGIYFSVPGLPE